MQGVHTSNGGAKLPEDLIGLAEAAKLLPSRKPGKRIHATTFYRWIQQGKIEGWRISGCWFVSRRAVLDLPVLAHTTPTLRTRRERHEAIEEARRVFYNGKGTNGHH